MASLWDLIESGSELQFYAVVGSLALAWILTEQVARLRRRSRT